MALPLPPASNLHAILLVTKSRTLGPRLVFHYPPLSPSAAALAATRSPAWFGNATSTGSLDSNSSSSDWDSTDENDDVDGEVASRTSGGRGSGRTGASHRDRDRFRAGTGSAWGRQENIDEEDADGSHSDGRGKGTSNGVQMGGDHDWDTVLGFKVDALEKILCPGKAFNKRRFELGVESIVFVGAPMFVRDDGLWKKLRRKKKTRTSEEKVQEGDMLANLSISQSDEDEELEYIQGFEPGYGHGLMSAAPSVTASEIGSDTPSTSTTNDTPDMTMFNVVFVLNPPALEYQQRVKDMYDHVTRKYAKALKYEQARFQYVWKESKKIIDMKQRAKESGETLTGAWRKIINASPLAKSIAILFDAISNDKIAHIHFDATFNTSFQIPQADSTPYLPSALEPQMPGLWLTTSNVVIEDDNDAPMTQHATLLLLEDAETLIKDLEGDAKGPSTALAFYIRNIVPTKSLQKISIKHNIAAQDMEYIARHLVYWRRARLIAPLHPRDTYIVSPNADMSALQAAIPAYATRFPTLPPLPKFLSMLSGTPRPYRTFIPTIEHRDAYMDILAWLMRGGWVTQLRTFAWVRVSPEIKAQVAAEMEREASSKARREVSDNDSLTESLLSDRRVPSYLSLHRPGTPLRRSTRHNLHDDHHHHHHHHHNESSMDGSTILSPRTPNPNTTTTTSSSTWRGSPARPSSDAGSTSSARTAVHRPASPQTTLHHQHQHHHHHRPEPRAPHPHRPSPLHLKTHTSPTLSPTSPSHPPSPPPSPQTFTPSLILNPTKANAEEARWLEKIGAQFEDEEVRAHWPMLLRHLDGRHAIEDVSPREGLKRKKVHALFAGVKEAGVLVVARHW
ncbi:hypothetical protein BS50DRAFT_579797 [Corynespora cassiicola Philippines]|uniref:Nitrogen permease regulator 3 n=1 Tax=Corynespora cassiicola Philippines TaxID=1448308 RepID=A0A2T2N2V7_CORCC|nr:hypothetical protein BS50DRAFT_579797 [Corynespora cassiicola Philippines]